jgi:hypothetical protein
MPEFDHSSVPTPFNPREAFNRRRTDHRGVVDSQNMALRAQQQIINENISQQRFGLQQQRLELEQMKAQAEMAKEAAMIRQQMQTEAHIAGAISGLAKLSPTDPEYATRMAEVFQANPMARTDPTVHSLVSSHLKVRETIDTTSEQIRATRERIAAEKSATMALRDDAKAREDAKFVDDANKTVLENQAAGELAEKINLKPSAIRDGKIVFGEGDKASQGTRKVVTDPTGMKTVTETRPITDAAPVTPAPATAATARPIFKDAKGRRAYKNPDGTFEEIP